jgi:hypothetical protein
VFKTGGSEKRVTYMPAELLDVRNLSGRGAEEKGDGEVPLNHQRLETI